jgi:recombination protein RecR
MLRNIPSLRKLIRQLQHIPYLASKNLYRVAAHILSSDKERVRHLCDAILEAREKIKPCKECFNWLEHGDICSICSSDRRDKSKICVVETWHDLIAIEKTDDYNGIYHVLGGSLCPLEGIGPDDLTVTALLKRVEVGEVTELILATNPTPEGEATASFIASKIASSREVISEVGEGKPKISRLASGIPIGYSLEQMDKVTIHKALAGRRPF